MDLLGSIAPSPSSPGLFPAPRTANTLSRLPILLPAVEPGVKIPAAPWEPVSPGVGGSVVKPDDNSRTKVVQMLKLIYKDIFQFLQYAFYSLHLHSYTN